MMLMSGASPTTALCQASVAESSVVLPPVIREHIMTPRIPLKVVIAPAVGVVLKAPPVLIASEHSVDYTCGRCGTVLLHADEDQVHGILIHCTRCGSYNSTDA
jgi:DNA-directed RNA polymerase subunit RPC12/RpoP